MPTVRRPTLKNDGTTDVWDNTPRYSPAARGKAFVANSDSITLAGYYTFPLVQRTTRPGLPQQTRHPKAP